MAVVVALCCEQASSQRARHSQALRQLQEGLLAEQEAHTAIALRLESITARKKETEDRLAKETARAAALQAQLAGEEPGGRETGWQWHECGYDERDMQHPGAASMVPAPPPAPQLPRRLTSATWRGSRTARTRRSVGRRPWSARERRRCRACSRS